MEEKDINNYTLGEKIGYIMAQVDSLSDKMDKYIEENQKRQEECEKLLKEHSKIIATARGKVSIIGSIWGAIAGIGISIVTWFITK